MSPNVGENQRQIEATPPTSSSEQAANNAVEKNVTASPENRPQTQSTVVSSQVATDMALPSQTIASGLAGDDMALTTSVVSTQASDTDRIEKEWVDKAKMVIERTKDDPYEQKNEMSKVKAEYIHRRFNKSIKADDPVIK